VVWKYSSLDKLLTFFEEAEDTEATLALQRVATGVIERFKGCVQCLEEASALPQVRIELIPDEIAGLIDVAGWRPRGMLRQAEETLTWVAVYVLRAIFSRPLCMLSVRAECCIVVYVEMCFGCKV
jgi:hypothetical protein